MNSIRRGEVASSESVLCAGAENEEPNYDKARNSNTEVQFSQ